MQLKRLQSWSRAYTLRSSPKTGALNYDSNSSEVLSQSSTGAPHFYIIALQLSGEIYVDGIIDAGASLDDAGH